MELPGLVYGIAIGLTVVATFGASAAEENAAAEPGMPAPDTSPLVHEIDLDVPVEEVWRVFSTAEGFRQLGVARAELDFRVGGTMRSHYDPKGVLGDPGTIEQTILAFEPRRMVAFRITKPPKGFPFTGAYKAMWSVATMTDLGQGRTHLRLAQLGYTPDPESQRMRAFFDQGNAWVLQALKRNLEGKAGEASPDSDGSTAAENAPPAGAESGLSPIRKEAVIEAPVSEVWRCWTTGAGVKSFLTEAKVELRIGGPFEIYFGPEASRGERGSEGCTILSYEPMRMLSFSWNAPPKFGDLRQKRTWVVLHLDPQGPHACRVRLDHLGFAEQAEGDPDRADDWALVRAYFDTAWPKVLGALREHFTASPEPATTNG